MDTATRTTPAKTRALRYQQLEGEQNEHHNMSPSSRLTQSRMRNDRLQMRFGKYEMQQNLARAIQMHAENLVDEMPFSESEIPDELIQDGCVTEDESKTIRSKTDRKDQVRKVIILIKGRSYDILEKFLKRVKRHCPQTVDNIWKQYDDLMKGNSRIRKCPTCQLKENVDIRYVIDFLYGKEVIITSFYDMVTDSHMQVGRQDSLWEPVLQACAESNFKYLIDILEDKGHYSHIAKSLKDYYRGGYNDPICLCSIAGFSHISALTANVDANESATTCSPDSTSRTSESDEETEVESLPEENTSLKRPIPVSKFINETAVGEGNRLRDLNDTEVKQGDLSDISVTTSQASDMTGSASVVSIETVIDYRNVHSLKPVSKDESSNQISEDELDNQITFEMGSQRSEVESPTCSCFCFKRCRRQRSFIRF